MESAILNYSRPIISTNNTAGSSSVPPPRPIRSPGRNARTDDESWHKRENHTRSRARSVPRARAVSPSPLSPTSPSSFTHSSQTVGTTNAAKWKQRESVLSQQSSLYPPSTVTSASAFSGPETPPEYSTNQAGVANAVDEPLLDADDVSYRLKLLVKNNYFLPPVHQKPTALQLNASPNSTVTPNTATNNSSSTLKSLFRGNKSPKTPPPPSIPHHHHLHSNPHVHPNAYSHTQHSPSSYPKPRNTRPQNRVVVIRETLPSLEPPPLPELTEEPAPSQHHVEAFIDPTTDVDCEQPIATRSPAQLIIERVSNQGDWRRDLLQQAVGLSFVTPPVRSHSLSASAENNVPIPFPPVGQPISTGMGTGGPNGFVAAREFRSPKQVNEASLLRSPNRNDGQNGTALRPPPRPPRDRNRGSDDSPQSHSPNHSPNTRTPHSPHGSTHSAGGGQSPSSFRGESHSFRDRSNSFHAQMDQSTEMPVVEEATRDRLMSPDVEFQHSSKMVIRPSFSVSPRPSFTSPSPQSPPYHSGPYPYSSSPFGHPTNLAPPRHSAATDLSLSTSTLHYDDHEHDMHRASRPSFTGSAYTAPRPSISESHVSHYSTTFGDRSRDRETRARSSTSKSDSRRSSLAYLQGSRSRSLSPSGARHASSQVQEAPPVPPLPVHSGSDTEARSTRTVIYVHPTGALSNTALGASTPATVHLSPRDGSLSGHGSSNGHESLDPKRGITNVPPPVSPSSPRFFGIISPAFMSPRSRALQLPATVDVDIVVGREPSIEEGAVGQKARSDQGHGDSASQRVENWRDAQVHSDEVRKFDGMVMQHIESEKDRFKKIATASKGRPE